MGAKRLKQIIENHKHWLIEDIDGRGDMRANLSGANLRFADLSCANLRGADLRDAILSDAKIGQDN